MRVLLVKPGKFPVVTDIVHDLPTMQEIVGGYIEASYPDGLPGVTLISNEDGKNLHLPLNRYVTLNDTPDIICGTFFLCGNDYETCNFCSLTDDQVNACIEKFRKPELFFNIGGQLVVIPSDEEAPDDE